MSFLELGTQECLVSRRAPSSISVSSHAPDHCYTLPGAPFPQQLLVVLLRRVGASEKSGEKGAGSPFIIWQYGGWGLGVVLWGWLALLAQVELGSGLPARWLGSLPGQG